jgi:hypothetical protein
VIGRGGYAVLTSILRRLQHFQHFASIDCKLIGPFYKQMSMSNNAEHAKVIPSPLQSSRIRQKPLSGIEDSEKLSENKPSK